MRPVLVWASVAVGVAVVVALVLAEFAARRRSRGVPGYPIARQLFSGLLPAVFAGYILLVALVALPVLHPAGPVPLARFVGSVLFSAVAAMALLETVKRLLPLRGAYNRRQVAVWLRERYPEQGAVCMGQLIRAMDLDEPIRRQLESTDPQLDLIVGRAWERVGFLGPGLGGVFNLPAEQFSAQVAAAAERAVRDPARYQELLLALCVGMDRDALAGLYPGGEPDDVRRREAVADVEYRIATAIDQLQIRLAGRWRHYLQATAWWLTGLVALLLALIDRTPAVHSATLVVVALLFGGFFAWLARDVSAVVERLRR